MLSDFLSLWDLLSGTTLQQGVDDTDVWRLSSSRRYIAKSAYKALCQGCIRFDPWRRIWKSWAPGKCKFFLWLVAHDRCWTTNRLARRNLPHPDLCPLRDQEEEIINHLLFSWVFAREFWFILVLWVSLGAFAPQVSEITFQEWWHQVLSSVSTPNRRASTPSSFLRLGHYGGKATIVFSMV
jgi:hypothetical protein